MNAQLDWLSMPREAWQERRDVGIQRAQGKAHQECGEHWTAAAATYIYHYAHAVARGKPFLIETARAKSVEPRYAIAQPTNGKAWGAAVRYAARRKWIRQVGVAPAHSSNGSFKPLWELVQ